MRKLQTINDEMRLLDRTAVAFYSGFTSWLLFSILWIIFEYEFEIVCSYHFVVIASIAMASLGFLLKQNVIANTFGALMKIIAEIVD